MPFVLTLIPTVLYMSKNEYKEWYKIIKKYNCLLFSLKICSYRYIKDIRYKTRAYLLC